MGFPDSHEALVAAGYRYGGEATCRLCHATIRWYKTPAGKTIPIDADCKQAHFASCGPYLEQQRKKKEKT